MKPIKVLIVDDSEQDADLLLRDLKKADYDVTFKRVDTAPAMNEALDTESWDIIISDHVMPDFSSLSALQLLRTRGLDIPFIIVSAQIGEDTAVEAMRSGAQDYLRKGDLKRLGPAIDRELKEAVNRQQRIKADSMLKEKEEELKLAKKMEMIKDEFIGMVSHELKTPLTVIIGGLSVASTEGVSQAQSKELIDGALTSAESLAAIVDNLLELSRHQSNHLTLQKERVDIEPVIQDVLRRLQTRSNKHHLHVSVPPNLPKVIFDKIRLERIVHNLVENAIKYSPQGGDVTVTVQPNDNELIVSVSDQGFGISKEDQSKLFQSFQRLESTKRPYIVGIGLGLRVCQILVEAHRGRIWVESEPGKGATFRFSLPLTESGN
jgi:two-component system sensor histidine kinase EvgS